MSTFAVTAEQLTIVPHPNADALELAQVGGEGGYRAVVRKGQYQTGDWAVYIPESALLPPELTEELGLTGRLAGSAANRVKAIRLRGELSQGIVCNPVALGKVDLAVAHAAETNFADELGITKWMPEIPASMSGQIIPAPNLIAWIEVEDYKRFPTAFATGESVIATEKVHGSATVITFDAQTAELFVTSKGYSRQRLALVESSANVYWRAVRNHGVEEVMQRLAGELGATRVGLFGEVYGAGVQDLQYGVHSRNTPGLAIFDSYIVMPDGQGRWLEQSELHRLLEGSLVTVPVLYEGPFDPAILLELASGKESLSGSDAHLREGIVVRAVPERYSAELGGRALVKFVSPDYLLRNGGTEYE